MNTFQLECFLAVAGTLSFARAAVQMNVSQPTITHQIKSLEDELNVKLFRRSTRLVEITSDGEAFISDAKSMVAIARHAKERFTSSTSKAVEVFSIGCSNHIQFALLTPVLQQIKKEFPNLHPRLFVYPLEKLFQLLETEHLDVIFDIYDNREIKSNIKYKQLGESDIVCVCSKDHRLATSDSIGINELSKEVLIFSDPMTITPDIAKIQHRFLENKAHDEIHFCSSPETAYILACSGYGTAILPGILLPPEERTVTIRLQDVPGLPYGLFHRPFPGDTIIRRFIELSKEIFEMP